MSKPLNHWFAKTVTALVIINIVLAFCWWKSESRSKAENRLGFEQYFSIYTVDQISNGRQSLKNSLKLDDATVKEYLDKYFEVSDRFHGRVAEDRTLRAVCRLARTIDDFPVTAGNDIVSCTYRTTGTPGSFVRWSWTPSGPTPEPLRVLFFVPEGLNEVNCSASLQWDDDTEAEVSQGTLFVDGGSVNELVCRITDGFRLELQNKTRDSPKGDSTWSAAIGGFCVTRQYVEIPFRRCIPGERLSPSWHKGGQTWSNSRLGRNEIFRQRLSVNAGNKVGQLTISCCVKSPQPDSYCALTLAANSPSFIDRVLVSRASAYTISYLDETLYCTVSDIFKPSDGTGQLHPRGKINFFPKRSY